MAHYFSDEYYNHAKSLTTFGKNSIIDVRKDPTYLLINQAFSLMLQSFEHFGMTVMQLHFTPLR